ncbi:MAG: mandelate racemase/muconate lactonizing enzyme family protein [Verrucomicrobiae bacterium]|nr:mandelate racemase/muconate lactonizing enzyme family protein [Verrucomicrobiae bacterium]
MSDRVASITVYALTQPRDVPYLGAARPGEEPNARGYLVRKGNRTVYPTFDRSVLVKIETAQGLTGWGETYGLVAPRAVAEIINDLLAGFTIGRDPSDPSAIYDDLYDLMRVRGYTGGFYVDALAAIDIALWDIAGRLAGKSVAELLGGRLRENIPAYISGLPKPTLKERVTFAREWMDQGFDSFKFASPVADDGVVMEMSELRNGLGPDARIACDMHWAYTPEEAIAEIKKMEPYGLWFAEAPVAPEDVEGLAEVTRGVQTPIGAGEEWRTLYEARLRLNAKAVNILQPEMGHIGITEFTRIAKAAHSLRLEVLPHATVGAGIFLAASLQASFALEGIVGHEFQHSVFNRNTGLITEGMECVKGLYQVTDSVGIGVELTERAIALLE